MHYEPRDLGPISNPSQALIHELTGRTMLGCEYALHRVHYGEDGVSPTLVRVRSTSITGQCHSGDLMGWAWDELSLVPTDYETEVILGLHPEPTHELHDAHVWDWMDAGIQELIDAPMVQVLTRLDAVANAWRDPKAWPFPVSVSPCGVLPIWDDYPDPTDVEEIRMARLGIEPSDIPF